MPTDAKLTVPEQIVSHGFEFEQFNVTTPDGYILSLWHVFDKSAPPKIDEATGQRKTIFMQHGLIDIAGTWFFNDPSKSIAYSLAKKGYDIWLGNNRGTANSYLHVNLT